MPRIITNNGTAIGYEERGAGCATPIVFLHGVGSDKFAWHPQLDRLGRSRRCIAFDYPGYGESDAAPKGTTRDDYATAIILAMQELKIDRAHICGLSLGGVVAIAIHHAAPQYCASLVLADTFARHPEGRVIYERSVSASSDLLAMAEARVDMLLAEPADPKVRSEIIETMSRINPAAYRIGAEAVWLADQRERAERINVPTLIVVGEFDRITPPCLSDELIGLIGGSRLEVIGSAGHLANLERPDEFNRLVETFVQEID